MAPLLKSAGAMGLPQFLGRWRPASGRAALRWLRRGVAAHGRQQYFNALAAWKEAAKFDEQEAVYRIGLLYAQGQGVAQSFGDAVIWYRRAAEGGHIEAQFQLGMIYLHGASSVLNGTSEWFTSATQRHRVHAQQNLDVLFPHGIVVEKNIEVAMRWLEAAATAGKAEAQVILGDLCRRGRGASQDHELARSWYSLAAFREMPLQSMGWEMSIISVLASLSIIGLALIGMRRPPGKATSGHGLR